METAQYNSNSLQKSNIKRSDGTYTETEKEANEYLVNTYFPKDERDKDTTLQKQRREINRIFTKDKETDITLDEIMNVIREQKKRKSGKLGQNTK